MQDLISLLEHAEVLGKLTAKQNERLASFAVLRVLNRTNRFSGKVIFGQMCY
jgi:hypothetical protein